MKFKKPWQLRDYTNFYKTYGRLLRLRKPQLFAEKLLYRKRHHVNNAHCTVLADKIAVRDYVKNKIGGDSLVPILAVYKSPAMLENDFFSYAGQVLKANHGSGMYYLIPEKPTTAQLEEATYLAQEWLNTDYSYKGESQYKNIDRRLFIEQFLGEAGKLAVTYYFHLFRQRDGDYNYVLQVIDKSQKPEVNAYYVNSLSQFHSGTFEADLSTQFKALTLALENSKKLLDNLDYARIDWYIIESKLYFSEITLTQGAGFSKNLTKDLEVLMGKFWDLALTPFNR